MGKPLTKPVKIAISIYLAMVLLVCSSYLVLILVGSLQGNDMSSSVLDTDHQHINSVTKDSNEGINDTKLNKASEQVMMLLKKKPFQIQMIQFQIQILKK